MPSCGHRNRGGDMPHLLRRIRRPGHGTQHRAQCQDPPGERVQCPRLPHRPRKAVARPARPLRAAAGKQVIIYADPQAYEALSGRYPDTLLQPATDQSFGTEFLDYKMAVKTVASFDEALNHIARYSSKHSECIVTDDEERKRQFTRRVDAACVYTNVSTAFTDGGQFGFGAEIGISTQKLHARGPMALPELTTYKYIISRQRTNPSIEKKMMRHFTNVHDIGDLKTAVREALEVKANRFAYKRLGENRTPHDDLLQFEPAHPPKHPKGGDEPGHERDGARREPGSLEARNRTRGSDGRRQARASARSHSRDGLLLRRDRRTLLCPLREQERRLRRENPQPV